jgi:glutamate 5-kinase
VIAPGREKNVLHRLLAGEKLGTVFLPAQRKLDSRQRWIGLTARPGGTVTIDDGAAAAVTSRGKSLLATGISQITGRFERGDVLLVRDPAGREIARGLSNYNADELRLIMGKRSNQFEKILGRPAYAEVIHRDNLVLLT